MSRWMGWHFHKWIDYNGIAFSIELLQWGRTLSNFGGIKFFTFTQTYQNVCTVVEN